MNDDRLTKEDLQAIDAIDMTEILGTPSERIKFALHKAVYFMRRMNIAETACKVAWNEHKHQAELASKAVELIKDIHDDANYSQLTTKTRRKIESFLLPYAEEFSENRNRRCPKCGKAGEMFTADLDWCPACKNQWPGT